MWQINNSDILFDIYYMFFWLCFDDAKNLREKGRWQYEKDVFNDAASHGVHY